MSDDRTPATAAATDGPFVHLRVHSAYSMSEGAIPVKKLGKLCRAGGMPAVAVTDTRNLFGALEFSVTVAGEGIQPIVGCLVAVRREETREGGFGAGRDVRAPLPDHVVLLCRDAAGWGNLIKLVSKAFLDGDGTEIPQVAMADLEAHAGGLICLTGGTAGPVGRLLLAEKRDEAEACLLRLAGAFPGALYVEVQRHDLPDEDRIEPALIELAYAHDLPLVATNDCFFPDAAMFEAHDALICMAEKALLGQADRRRLTPHHRFKTAAEMRETFADLPEAVDNTLVVARRCAFMVETRDPILPHAVREPGKTEAQALREMAAEGLDKRLAVHVWTAAMDPGTREEKARPYRERLDRELGIIESMGFPGYFIIVADFIQWAKARSIPVGPGRGSGAGSVVAWALTITDLDPLRFNLLFERFLNPERVSMPDFDIDFCQERREEVIRHVQDTYGHDRVAQIITFGKLQARAVLRSVGRVMEMPLGYVDRICKLVPNNPANPVSLPDAIAQEPQLRALRDEDEQVARMLDVGQKLEGLYSHASTHAAGVVIGNRPLDELVPLYRDPHAEMPVTQFNMKWVEQAGLVKFDFLGLKTLTVLQKAVDLLARRGVAVDLSALPLDDRPTYDMLGRGETVGVFQLESQGMRDVLTRLKPDCLEDVIAIVALYRPGPMDNIPSFINRKNGEETVVHIHPDLAPILDETYGIMVYQEQVMQAAQILAGYSLGGADLLRRAMGKKVKAQMDAERTKFEDGCEKNGIPRGRASEIFDTIAKFAGYGFNKSHAAAYAYVAYQTAFLKANHPVEFMAALMTYDMHNTEKLEFFKGELQRLGVPLLPPDVNRSEVQFGVEYDARPEGAVRHALAAVRNVGEAAMASVVAEREAGGPYRSPADFARRIDPRAVNRRSIENLGKAGAFDAVEPNRRRVVEGAEILMRHAQAATEERASGQVSLFGDGGGGPAEEAVRLPKVEAWRGLEVLNAEKEAIGFFLSAHPLDGFATAMERLDVVPSSAVAQRLRNAGGTALLKMAGIPGARKERTGKTGARYAFLALSDAGGSYEAMLFSEVLGTARPILEAGEPLLLTMDARLDGEQVRLAAKAVEPLKAAVGRVTKKIKVVIEAEEPLDRLGRIVRQAPAGRGRLSFVARTAAQEIELPLNRGLALDGSVIDALRDVPGVVEVVEV